MIRNLRIDLMRLFYNDNELTKTSKKLDEMESFFDALKLFDNFEVNELTDLFYSQNNKPRKSKTRLDKIDNFSGLQSTLLNNGLDALNYDNITIEQVEALEANESFTKTLALQLANSIGISKKSYKSRREIFEDISRMISNRDTLNATKNALSSDAPTISESKLDTTLF